MDDLESRLRKQLAEIRRRADEEAAPIIEQLTAIEASRPRVPMAISQLPGESLVQMIARRGRMVAEESRAFCDAIGFGTGAMLGEQHIPLKEFQPEPADETCQNGRESG